MDFLTYISHKIIKIIIPHISNKIKSIMTSLQYLQQTKKKGQEKTFGPSRNINIQYKTNMVAKTFRSSYFVYQGNLRKQTLV